MGAAATGAGTACTDQALPAGHTFLLQPVPRGAGSKLLWSRNCPCTDQPDNFKKGGSFCLSRGPGGLYFVPAKYSAPAEFGIVSSSKIHVSTDDRFQREHSNAWQSVSVPLSGMGNFPIAVSWDEG